MTDYPPPPPPQDPFSQDPFSSNPPPPPPPAQGWYPPPPPGPAPFEQPPQYPPSYMPGYAPAYGAAYPAPRRNNGPALASLICGIVTFASCGVTAIPAVICGHIALSQLKRDPTQDGRGMAIAGLVLGYLTIVAALVFVVFVVAAANDPAFQDF